ncbi:hypothetical protein [Mucilaginibacter antarcticus]
MRSGAFKIAALYTVTGLLWIVLSDRLLDLFSGAMGISSIIF